MNQTLTLGQVAPDQSLADRFKTYGLWILVLVILMLTYVETNINPAMLWDKRNNAVEYLFGRETTEQDQDAAMRQAERLPEIMVIEDTYQELKQEAEARGQSIDPAQLRRKARQIGEERLAAMDPAERQKMITDEYERIVDEKRGGYFPPETGLGNIKHYTSALLETLAIAIWGTLLAFALAIPFSMLAAYNTLELVIQGDRWTHRALRWFGQFVARRILDFCRGFNEFVMALIFVAVIGLGPFAGVLALAIHTFGILGKVFSEAIEQIDSGQVEAVMASGANPTQTMAFAVIPQVMPLVVSYSLLRFESNVRSATILGFVGAGGIGFLMFDKISGYLYREVCTMMIMVIVTVSIIDYFCSKLRRKFS